MKTLEKSIIFVAFTDSTWPESFWALLGYNGSTQLEVGYNWSVAEMHTKARTIQTMETLKPETNCSLFIHLLQCFHIMHCVSFNTPAFQLLDIASLLQVGKQTSHKL
jgi:hypothetical protein